MKTLFLHCDYIKFKPVKKALKNIKELSEKEKREKKVENALAVLVAVEKRDADVEKVAGKLVDEIKDISKQVKAKKIVL